MNQVNEKQTFFYFETFQFIDLNIERLYELVVEILRKEVINHCGFRGFVDFRAFFYFLGIGSFLKTRQKFRYLTLKHGRCSAVVVK